MTTREEWLRLAERCEAATGPGDHAVIASTTRAILSVLGYEEDCGYWHVPSTGDWVKDCNRIMISIDAITALIEREMPECDWQVCNSGECTLIYGEGVHEPLFTETKANTPAIALTAAFCRAKAEMVR